MLEFPHTQGITYEQMPDELQEEVDSRVEMYSEETFENGTANGEDVALFYVGEGTTVDGIVDMVDYSDDQNGVVEGNVTAAAIERVADEVLEATDADTTVIWDRTENRPIYQEDVDPDNPYADRAEPLDIVESIADHYEEIESKNRQKAFIEQFNSVLSDASPEVKETMIQARQDAYESFDEHEKNEDIENPELMAQKDMLESIRDSGVDPEKLNEALEGIDVNTDPVFTRTMKMGYSMERRDQKLDA